MARRLFGPECLNTLNVEHIGDLCIKMLSHLEGMNDWMYNIRYFPGNKVSLYVGGFLSENPEGGPNPEPDTLYPFLRNEIQKFNWDSPLNPLDRRFFLCSINLLGLEASKTMPEPGMVTKVNSLICDCYMLLPPFRVTH